MEVGSPIVTSATPSGAAGGVLSGTYPNPGFAANPAFSGTVTTSGATTTSPDFEAWITGDTFARVTVGTNSTDIAHISFGTGNVARDLFLERAEAAHLRLGSVAVDTAPVAQTISVQNVLAGGTNNVAGANFTIDGSQGKGTGVGGSIIFRTAAAGSTGNTVNALAAALTIAGDKSAAFTGRVTALSLALGGATLGSDSLAVTGTATIGGGLIVGSTTVLKFNTRSRIVSTANGLMSLTNTDDTAGVLADFSTDSVVKFRNRANNADAAVTGLSFTSSTAGAILNSSVTITGGATGNVPTLTAGPVTGNPTKWLPYNDNGTTRYIPAW